MLHIPAMPSHQRFGVAALFSAAFFSSLLTIGVLSTRYHDDFRLVSELHNEPVLCEHHIVNGLSRDALGGVEKHDVPQTIPEIPNGIRPSPQLLGPPADSFRDNLRNDTLYLTAIFDTGWTNEVMAHGNMIYLAFLTQRVPILPAFAPSHVGWDQRRVPFSEVFDLPRLAAAVHMPIIEWDDLKDTNSVVDDTLGCWSNWATASKTQPRHSWMTERMHVDISYTPVPDWAVLGDQDHANFFKLAKLSNPDVRQQSLGTPQPSHVLGATLHPDHQMLCFDVPYFISADEPWEYERDYSPVWHTVMKHAHFTPRLEAFADEYLRTTFQLSSDASIPPFITIHARHGDFGGQCAGLSANECFTPLSVWRKHVDELREELRATKGVEVAHVIVTSDERDEAWWNMVAEMGWYRIDHEKMHTEERFDSKWYPIFLDVTIQARSKGFLGTQGSTLSLLALRRTRDWNDGLGKTVMWNQFGLHPDALQARRRSLD